MRERAAGFLLGLLLLGVPARGEPQTAEEIDACYRANFPQESSEQSISMRSQDRIGAVTESKARMYWKRFDDGRARVMMRFFKPADLRGAGLLMVEQEARNDMFLYLPELGRVKRITSRMTSASMFGTDFSYEEFERLQGIADDASVSRLDDDEAMGRPCYVLDIRPAAEDDSAYERIEACIDKETCVTLRAEFFERGDRPRKVLTSDPAKVTQEDGVWVPRESVMRDFRDETQTTMIVEEIEVGKAIPRKVFSERELVSGGR